MEHPETLEALGRYGLPEVAAGDRVEFLGFGAPDQYWDPQTESYKPIPDQLKPGTLGTVEGVGYGQLHVSWDSGHGVSLVVAPLGTVEEKGFKPDRYRLVKQAPTRRRRLSELAERAAA